MSEKKYHVSIVKVQDDQRQDAVRQAMDLIGGIAKYAKPGQKVMLKPNYVGMLDPDDGAVTSPKTLEAIILYLQENGIKDILIAESCGPIHVGTDNIYRKVGIYDMAERLGVQVMDLNKAKMVEKTHPRFEELQSLKLAEVIFDQDLIINVPVIKTHAMTGATCAVKNMKGVLAPGEKRHFHRIHLANAIAEMHLALPQNIITIVDGIVGQEGLGPAEGTPVPLGVIMAGDNMVAVDGVVFRIMGFEPTDIKHAARAAELGLGSLDLADIDVLGVQIDEIKRPFRPATAEVKEVEGVEIYEQNACSCCIAPMMIALGRMAAINDLEKFKDLQVCVGTGKPAGLEEYKKFFYIGKCSKANYDRESQLHPGKVFYVDGCAPAAIEIEEVIRDVYGIDRSDPTFCFGIPGKKD